MEPKERISKVQPIWKRLGFSSEEEMTKREAIYYKRAAKAIADMRWEQYKNDKENRRNADR